MLAGKQPALRRDCVAVIQRQATGKMGLKTILNLLLESGLWKSLTAGYVNIRPVPKIVWCKVHKWGRRPKKAWLVMADADGWQ